jgi:saccharopepsin
MFRSIAYLTLLATALVVQSSEAAVMTVAVEKIARNHPVNVVQHVARHPVNAAQRVLSTAGTPQSAPKKGTVKLNYTQDVGYIGEMQIGTPPQKFKVLYGTGSNVIWAPNTKINKHAYYNSAASSTFVKNGTYYQVQYNGGLVTGFVSVDTIGFGGLTVPNVKIMEASNTTGFPGYADSPYDGIFGLGLDVDGPYKLPNPVQQLAAEGKLDKPQFAFYLGDKASPELSIGGVNPARFTGEINYVPASSWPWWIELDGVKVGNTVISPDRIDAMVDSGSSGFLVPPTQLVAIAKAVGAVQTPEGDYTVDCEAPGPNVSFTLGGKQYAIEKAQYVYKGSDGECYLDMQDSGDEYWMIGSAFMQKVYTVFDFGINNTDPRIGFAQAV